MKKISIYLIILIFIIIIISSCVTKAPMRFTMPNNGKGSPGERGVSASTTITQTPILSETTPTSTSTPIITPIPPLFAPRPTSTPTLSCDQSLWKHIYDENSNLTFRLLMVNPCIMVTGTVTKIFPSGPPPDNNSDGDYHINIKLDPQYSNLINENNTKYQNGDLVSEVICAFTPSYTDAVKACQGFSQNLTVSVGDYVQVTGAYVIDNGKGDISPTQSNGWAEIHPITLMTKV